MLCGFSIYLSIHSFIQIVTNIHTFILSNVCAGMREHTATLTISQGLRDPSAPQAVKKVHYASLYFSFRGLYLFFLFVIESLSHFYSVKIKGISNIHCESDKASTAVSQWNFLLSPFACMWRSLVCQTYSNLSQCL